MNVKIEPNEVGGTITAPPSKSMMQRAVALAALANGTTTITNPSFCDDCMAALGVARAFGAEIIRDENSVQISSSKDPIADTLDCKESGLCIRMFSPIAALFDKEIALTGHGSIFSRPVGMIEEPLRVLGATCKTNNGKPPVVVCGRIKGGETIVDGLESSQFLTGLLIALPLCENDSIVTVENLKSRPYVDMTLQIARKFGAMIKETENRFVIKGKQKYSSLDCNIEGDWSGAAFMLVASAIAGNAEVKIDGLRMDSTQADKAVLTALERCGNGRHGSALSSFEFDATDCPDLFPPLVALACNCKGTSRITGVDRLRHKESDRAQALVEEFTKIGAKLRIDRNALEIAGAKLNGGVVDSRGDHRIAMACAIAALNSENGVTIQNAGCVSKSYPDFFDDLKRLGVNITEVDI